ncbi:caprin-2-like [Mercenaria mercenaria]|uniref:caprin-2-like n=1 Tax=Mercenaria mercenaria TaxID=6596 RepID=UPI00234E5181|nr:caprin-2-like [Mercenaria mercenaria]
MTVKSRIIVFTAVVCLTYAAAQNDDLLAALTEKIETLEKQARDDRHTFQTQLAKQAARISQLELQLSAYQKNFDEEQVPVERKEPKQSTQNGQLKSSLSHKGIRRQIGGGYGVAFTAYMSKHASGLGHQDTIPFDSLILNEGQGFNTNSHTFTCPVSGVYTFQTALLSQLRTIAITEIVKEGVSLVQAHAEPGSTDGYDQGFNSVVTTCNKGENVWVRNYKHFGTAVYSARYTTFTGFLLWEVENVNSGIVG